MANNFNPFTDARSCKEFHRVDVKLYGSKDAFKDALACGVAIKCAKCGMLATQLPDMAVAVFGAPPKWFLRVIRNASNELVVIDTPRRS